jgi:hypothetical protein
MPMIPLPPAPMQGPPGMPADPSMMGAPPMGGGMGPVPLPPVPAELAGQAAAEMVPMQQQAQAMLTQQQSQEVLAAMLSQLAGAPNPEAEAAQSEPSPQLTPDAGIAPPSSDDPFGGV